MGSPERQEGNSYQPKEPAKPRFGKRFFYRKPKLLVKPQEAVPQEKPDVTFDAYRKIVPPNIEHYFHPQFPRHETEAAAEKPILTAQEARSVLMRESTKFSDKRPESYYSAFTLTLDRLIGSGIITDRSEIFETIVDPERPANLENIAQSLDALWTVKVTHRLRTGVLSQVGEFDKAATIGSLLQVLGKQQPQRLQELLGAAIASSPIGEGPMIALILAEEAYDERALNFSDTQFQGPAQLKNIPPALQNLIHFPLPKSWREGKIDQPVEEYAEVPTLGDIFKQYTPAEAALLKQALNQGSIGGAIFQSTLSQMQALQKDELKGIQEYVAKLERTDAEMKRLAKESPSPIPQVKLTQAMRTVTTPDGEKRMFDKPLIDNAVYDMILYITEGRNTFPSQAEDNLFSPTHIAYFQQRLAAGDDIHDIQYAARALAYELIQQAANKS